MDKNPAGGGLNTLKSGLSTGGIGSGPNTTTSARPPLAMGVSSETAGRIRRQIISSQTAAAQNAAALPLNVLQQAKVARLPGLASAGIGAETLAEMLKATQEAPQPLVDAKVGEFYRRTIPPAFTLGAELYQKVLQERERLLQVRALERIAQLETKLADDNLEGSERTRLLIELKTLRLRDLQKTMRERILRLTYELKNVNAFNERAGLRRGKRQSMREARQAEQSAAAYERAQRRERVQREREANDFIKSVIQHQRELQSRWRAAAQRRARLVKQVMHHHNNFEKEENKRSERLMKERMKALKNNDEAAYYKLLDQEKDVRLHYLLKQTDEFLLNLTEKVRAHQEVTEQRLQADRTGVRTPIDDSTLGNTADDRSLRLQEHQLQGFEDRAISDFYHKIHKEQVTIVEQPRMLQSGTLKDYQMKGLQWMVSLHENRLNGILADEMGLGKTIQTIALISYLMETLKLTGPFLIIVPLSTMTNWSMEFEKWAPQVQRIEYKGVPAQRKALQHQIRHGQFNVLLTTYEYIIKDRPALCKTKWLYLIVDEGHRMKNAHSKLTTVLTQHYSMRYRLILTGTPLQNNLPELWALLNFLLPDVFNSCKTFEEWFNAPFANTGERMELNEEELLLVIRRLHKVLHPFLLRRMKKDVEAELPDKIEIVLKCPMSALQSTLYRAITSRSASALRDPRNLGIRRLNNTIMQLRKICNHPFVFDEVERQVNPRHINNELLYRVAGKFELLQRILPKFAASGHKVLMFFQMTQIMTIMEDFLNMQGFKYLRLDGSTKAEDRTELLRKFNAPEAPYFIFLLSTRAGGLGLNLQTADTVVIFDSDWNPHQDLQAQDRAHRIGQTKEVRIFRLITVESVEEYILKRAQHKLSLDGKIIQAGKFDQRSTNEERDEMLRAILEREAETDEATEIYDDEELNEIIARNDNELTLFKQLDEERAAIEKARFERTSIRQARLVDSSELPQVYLTMDEVNEGGDTTSTGTAPTEEIESDYTMRAARRRDVSYNENISDEKWLRQLEQQETGSTGGSSEGSRRGRKRKYGETDGVTSDEHSSEVGGGGTPRNRSPSTSQKLLKLKLRVPVVLATNGGSPLKGKKAMTTASQGRRHVDDGLSPDKRYAIMKAIFSTVENCLDEGRYRSDLFLELPDHTVYADYYRVIKHPISLAEIEARLESADKPYISIGEFMGDMERMFANALQYNVEGSQVYEDAQVMRQLTQDKLEELMEAEGRFSAVDASATEAEGDEVIGDDVDDGDEEESIHSSAMLTDQDLDQHDLGDDHDEENEEASL